jgi:colanic acid/amylovoran biosynthesis glycosyltransferase
MLPDKSHSSAPIVVMAHEFPSVSETFVTDQVDGLLARGLNLRIVSHFRGDESLVHANASILASRTTYIEDSFRSPKWLPRALRSRIHRGHSTRLLYREALRSAKLILCHFGPVGFRAADALRGIDGPQLWTVFHGYDLSLYPKKFGAGVYARLFARGDRFFGVSRLWTAKLERLGCPTDRIGLMRMGVDVDRVPFAQRCALARQGLRFLSVGRLVEKKGTETALRALAEINRLRPQLDWSYEVIGSGPLRSRLRRLRDELGLTGRVSFSGMKSEAEVKARLAQADLFILPSRAAGDGDMEGIPVALMEAMASGVPVLSTFHSGIPELIEHGVTGLLGPERDHAVLAANILMLIDNAELRSRIVIAARQKVERDFNQTKLLDELSALIRAAIESTNQDSDMVQPSVQS